MLQPIRAGMTRSLGQRPAVLTPRIRDQSQHQRPGVTQCLAPGKPRRDTVENLIKPQTPAFNVYAMSRRRPRLILLSSQASNNAAVTA